MTTKQKIGHISQEVAEELLEACIAQHEALDTLFAILIERDLMGRNCLENHFLHYNRVTVLSHTQKADKINLVDMKE